MVIKIFQTVSIHDKEILYRLAGQKVKIAYHPFNMERKDLWYKFDAGICERPMVLAEAGGVRDDVLPLPESILEYEDSWARGIERALRFEIYQFEVLKDDHVVEPFININWTAITLIGLENLMLCIV